MSKNKKTKTKSPKSQQPESNFIKHNYIYLILIFIIAYYLYLCNKVGFIQDDTYITLQYVKHFADGNGLVFNIGQRVEGFTSLIWVLLLSFTYKLGFNIESVSQVLSMTFGAVNLAMSYFIFYEIAANANNKKTDVNIIKIFAVLSVLITSLSGTYYYWSVSGMETSLFTMFFLITVYLYLKYYLNNRLNIALPILIFITSLIRPEGNLLFALVIVHLFLSTLFETKFSIKQSLKKVFSKNRVKGYVIFLVFFALITLFRIIYFGYPLPNTFYAKTSFSIEQIKTGLDYFISFASDYLFYGVLLVAPLYLIRYKEKFVSISFLLLSVLVFIVYTIFVGGDVLKQYRFFVPVLPLINILSYLLLYFVSTTLEDSERRTSLPMLLIMPLAAAVFINIINSSTVESSAKKEKNFVDMMKSNALWLKEQSRFSDHKITVATSTIGALAYFSDVNVLDMLGLTEPYIAHYPERIESISGDNVGWKEKKYNAQYVLNRKPDYILFSTQEKPSSYAERALFTKDDFHANYFSFLYDPDAKVYQSIYRIRDNKLELRKEIINNNPDFSIKYISKYNQVLNMLNLPKSKINFKNLISECKELIDISPAYFGDPYRFLAWSYAQIGNKTEAVNNAEIAVEIDGVNLKASLLLIIPDLSLEIFIGDNKGPTKKICT
ncbi:MAG: hypothetical protein WAV89_03840 [Ignavibacteriaceae bacterium]